MDLIYATAFSPPQPEILGRRLLPLSLGHVVLLEAGGSPFVAPAPERRANAGDLAAAVWICSQPAGELRFRLDAPEQSEIIRWGLRQRALSLVDERRAFIAYLNDSLQFPPAWHGDGSRAPVAAWQFSVAAALIESGIGRAEAWDMPVAEALALYAAIQERHGLDLVSERDQRDIDALEQQDAAGRDA